MTEERRDLIEMAVLDPAATLKICATALREKTETSEERASILYARGLAERATGQIERALATLLSAISAADAVGAERLAREARTSVAPVLLFSGDAAAALRALDDALVGADSGEVAMVECQRAGVFMMVGRSSEALAAYDVALPLLDRPDTQVLLANGLTNRGVLHLYAGRPLEAIEDFERGRQIYVAHGQRFEAAEMTRNLGAAAVRRGDIPTALARFDDAEEIFAGRRNLGTLGLDRCEAFLAVGLARDAAVLAARTARDLTKSGDHLGAAEALLIEAQSHSALEDFPRAEVVAASAMRAFTAQGRSTFAAIAELEHARARFAGGNVDPTFVGDVVELGGRLASLGSTVPAATAMLLAARAAAAAGEAVAASTHLAGAQAVEAAITVDVAVHRALAEAEIALLAQRIDDARTAINDGLATVRRSQSTLGATDTRAHVSGHAVALGRLGLQLAVDSSEPIAVYSALERHRATALRYRPARPADDDDLARYLDELRAVVFELRTNDLSPDDRMRLARQQAVLERDIRRRFQRAGGTGDGPAESAGDLDPSTVIAALGEARLVSFGIDRQRLLAVTLDHDGISLHRLDIDADTLAADIARVRFMLDRIASGQPDAGRDLVAVASRVNAVLAPVIGDVARLIVVPVGALANLPLRVLPVLADRAFAVVPSVHSWQFAAVGTTEPTLGTAESNRLTVFASGPRLDHAEREVRDLADLVPNSTALVGDAASVSAVRSAFARADIVHVACHGNLRDDNPLFSSLELADGPLTVYDLERLPSTSPLVVLSACDAAVGAPRPGDELLGFVSALLPRGTRSVVAATSLLPDADATLALMRHFHHAVLTGEPPAVALASAYDTVTSTFTNDPRVAALAAVTCFGSGFR